MPHALALHSEPIALELHRLLRDLDPSRWREELESSVRSRVAAIAEAFSGLLARFEAWRGDQPLADRVAALIELLRHHAPRRGLPRGELRLAWDGYRRQLGAAYEELSQRLRVQAVLLPSLRPTNHARSLVHVATGVAAVVCIEHLLSAWGRAIAPAIFAGTFWSLELWRRRSPAANRVLMWIFRGIAHPREAHQVNSSTWFATALTVIGLVCPAAVCSVAAVVIGLADPAAALVGRRSGRVRLINGRTLEGSLTFLGVAFAAGFGVLGIWHGGIGLGRAVLLALAAALPATVVELASRRVDDNFSVPLTAAAGAWVAWLLLGL